MAVTETTNQRPFLKMFNFGTAVEKAEAAPFDDLEPWEEESSLNEA